MNSNACSEFLTESKWKSAVDQPGRGRYLGSQTLLTSIATQSTASLIQEGFRIFNNGGSPLIERRRGHLRQEIVFVPAPAMLRREDLPFSVRVHVSSREVAQVRSRYWRPACRAPESVASGNIGELQTRPVYYLFHAHQPTACVETLTALFNRTVLPWFKIFEEPLTLKRRLYQDAMPLVSGSTALELILCEFDPFEARKFIRMRTEVESLPEGPIEEIEGFDLQSNRLRATQAYFRL